MSTALQHGGGYGWLGVLWIVVAALVALGCVLWYRSRNDRPNPHIAHEYHFPGFGVVKVTPIHTDTQGAGHDVTTETAERRAYGLFEAYTRTWLQCTRVYGWGRQHWPIESVMVVNGLVHKDHPHVVWNAPIPRVWVRLQDGMREWFAREVHNVFRYHIHGMKHIYKTIDDRDLMRAHEIAEWIRVEYGGPDE